MPTPLRPQRQLPDGPTPSWQLEPTPDDMNALQVAVTLAELLEDTRGSRFLLELSRRLRYVLDGYPLEPFALDDAIQLLLVVGRMPAQLIQYNWQLRDQGLQQYLVVIPELSGIMQRLVQLGWRIAKHASRGRIGMRDLAGQELLPARHSSGGTA